MGSQVRVDLWESKLAEYLENVGPFEWGQNDCCLFAANAVEVITGTDPAKKYRGYKTKLGAAKKLKDLGIEGAWSKEFGDPINPKLCKRGDVVLFQNGQEQSIGVCMGTKFAAIAEEGLIMLDMQKHAIMGWKI
jgi:hypothetical protein